MEFVQELYRNTLHKLILMASKISFKYIKKDVAFYNPLTFFI